MNPPPSWTQRFTLARLVLLVTLLLFALYPEIFLGTHSFFARDFGLFTAPVAHFTRESFWRGEIPLWNPLNNCGVPFLAQWNTTVLYPPSLIYILLPLPWSLDFFCLGHLALAGAAMYLLAFCWTQNRFAASVAGLAFALNGLAFNCLMWTSNLAALAWMPLVILCVERAWSRGGKSIAMAALAGAMQMLAGSPEIILLTWLLLASLWLGEIFRAKISRKLLLTRFGGVAVLVFGLSTAQLLPFFQLLAHAHRDTASAHLWAMPAWGAANFLVPLFRCTPSTLGVFSQEEQQWTSSYYLGIGIVALAALAVWKIKTPRVRWLALVAVAGVLLAMGDHTSLFPLVRHVIPFVTLARYPIKFVTLTAFALPLLAAFAADWLGQPPAELRRSLFWLPIILLLAILAIFALSPHSSAYRADVWKNAAVRALFLVLLFAGIFKLTRMPDARRGWIGFGILFLLGLDALTHAPRQNPTVPNRAYGDVPPAMSARPRFGESRAMLSPPMQALWGNLAIDDPLEDFTGQRRALYDDVNLLVDIPKLNGFFSLGLRDTGDVLALIYPSTNPPAALLDFLGAAQISDHATMFQWNARKTFLPLITAGQHPVFADAPETLRALAAPDFNPRETVYLPSDTREFVNATNPASVKIVSPKFSAQEISATVEADAPALVVIAQSFYPCWHAYVDGRPEKLLRANHAFQAVEIPAGKHEVLLRYEDRAFHAGAWISLATLAGCLVFGGWPRRTATSLLPSWRR